METEEQQIGETESPAEPEAPVAPGDGTDEPDTGGGDGEEESA
jgi:hypothetical protein